VGLEQILKGFCQDCKEVVRAEHWAHNVWKRSDKRSERPVE